MDPPGRLLRTSARSPSPAKNVIMIFCAGAVSQLETWDYKPELIRHDGKPLAGGPPVTFQGPAGDRVMTAVSVSAAGVRRASGSRT